MTPIYIILFATGIILIPVGLLVIVLGVAGNIICGRTWLDCWGRISFPSVSGLCLVSVGSVGIYAARFVNKLFGWQATEVSMTSVLTGGMVLFVGALMVGLILELPDVIRHRCKTDPVWSILGSLSEKYIGFCAYPPIRLLIFSVVMYPVTDLIFQYALDNGWLK